MYINAVIHAIDLLDLRKVSGGVAAVDWAYGPEISQQI